MKFHKGFFSLIQFCPDPARLEAANVGVLLFCPELGFLRALTVRDNRRVQRFFGSEGQDWQQLNLFKTAFRQRIELEQTRITSVDELQAFVGGRVDAHQREEVVGSDCVPFAEGGHDGVGRESCVAVPFGAYAVLV